MWLISKKYSVSKNYDSYKKVADDARTACDEIGNRRKPETTQCYLKVADK